jgi:hypothetical protein
MSSRKIYKTENSMMREMLKEAGYVTASLRPLSGSRAECSEIMIQRISDNTIEEMRRPALATVRNSDHFQ